VERIVFLDRKTLRTTLKPPRFQHEWREYETTPPEKTTERLLDATIAITNKVRLTAHELKPLRALRLIAVAATGIDVIDLDYCRQNKITVCNVPHYATASVAELTFSMILALRRNIRNYRTAVKAGLWQKSPTFALLDYPTHEIAGSTLGIIGYGEIGRAVDERAKAFGMNVLIAERKHAATIREGRTPFPEVLVRCDVLTLHAPLCAETRKLIGSTELTRMKPTALLINTSRGGLVDEQALANALEMGLLAGAGVDVLSQEPPTDDNPLLARSAMPNLMITPHIGWASEEAVRRLADQLINNIECFVGNIPKNIVS
jgi:glycerate dehydrogenase